MRRLGPETAVVVMPQAAPSAVLLLWLLLLRWQYHYASPLQSHPLVRPRAAPRVAERLQGSLKFCCSFVQGQVRVVAAAQSAGLHVHCRGLDLSARECSALGRRFPLLHSPLLLPPGACPEAGLLLPSASLLRLLPPGEMPAQARLPLAGRRPHQAERAPPQDRRRQERLAAWLTRKSKKSLAIDADRQSCAAMRIW